MEHFLLPKNPSSPPVKVPYVCQEPYDGGPFLEYPIRKNKPWLLCDSASPSYMVHRIREATHPTPARELEAFLQTWLFFGLLQALQGDNFNAEDYIVTDSIHPTIRYISTSKILHNLDEARRAERTILATNAAKKEQLETVNQYLQLAMDVSRTIQEDFDWRIRLSIVSVCETLAFSIWSSFKATGIDGRLIWGYTYKFYNKEIRAEMRRNGWCPCDIARLDDKFQYLQTLYFVSKIKKLDTTLDHTNCTSDLCALYQTNAEAYQTKHRRRGCNCPDITINSKTVVEILRRGNLPLLKVVELKDQPNELLIEIVESTRETPYVPISHVWKDGMGNPSSNALPQCQSRHISTLVNQLKPELFQKPTSGTLLFWIDTLCCPVQPLDDKLLAISMLRKTYSNATAVLVMDAELQLCDHLEISGIEILARLYTSGWMHRLWTLQEGGLAKRLLFQFKQKAIDLEQQFEKLEAAMLSDARLLGPYIDFSQQQTAVMKFLDPTWQSTQDWHQVGAHLRRIDTALQNRSATVKADEPLCLATLLNLEIDFKEVPETLPSRMCHIWKSLAAKYGGLPQQMVFLEYPKLKVPGFQWAPESLMHASGGDRFSSFSRSSFWSDPKLGQVDPRGFLVEFSGFILKRSIPVGRTPAESLVMPSETYVGFTADDGTLYQLGRSRTKSDIVKDKEQAIHDLISRGSCALLTANPIIKTSPGNRHVQGLIIDITKNEERILYGQTRYLVILSEPVPSMKLAMVNAERLGQTLRRDPASRLATKLMANKQSTEYIAAVTALQTRVQEITKNALRNVPGLSAAVSDIFGGDKALAKYWIFVNQAYRYASFEGTTLSDDQKWHLE